MSLFEVAAKIFLDTSGYEKGLSKAENITKSFGDKLGNGLKTAAKAGAVAIGAATTAVTALATKSVKSYSQYEQLKGGVEKLFEKSANQIMKYANNAYRTSGMSANQYMEQATSFSASLIGSLGGDTAAAAKQTDVAMRAMSDNVNVFGSDMQDVQNAFQGFAKQNYTMLDNLKLGYGGTKTEMQRLISDANAYAKSIGQASDLSIDSFSDIITAIDLIQQKQNIAGTTSKEAAKTIEGSFNSLKASWENLVTGFSDKNANISKLTKTVSKNAITAFENILPAAKQAFIGIGKAIEEVSPIISKKLPKVINDLLPAAIESAGNLLKSIGQALPGLITTVVPTLISAAKSAINSLAAAIPGMINAGKALFDAGIQIVNSLIDGIQNNFNKIFPIGMEIITNLSEKIRDGAGKLVDAGLKLIMSLADGLIKNIPTLIKTVPTIISNLAGIINDNAPKLLKAGAELIVKLAKGIISAIPTLVKEAPKIIKAVVDVWTAFNWMALGTKLITGIVNGVKSIAKHIPDALKSIGENASKIFQGINWQAAGQKAVSIITKGITSFIQNFEKIMVQFGKAGMLAFQQVDWKSVGKKAVTFIANAAKTAFNLAKTALTFVGNKAIEAFRSVDWAAVGKKAINFIGNAAKAAFNLAVTALKYVGNQAKEAFKDVDWAAVGKKAIDFIGNAARNAFNIVSNALKYVGNQAKEAFKSIDWADLGRNLLNGIASGISKGVDTIKNAARDAAGKALNAAKDFLGIASPSKVAKKQIGIPFVQGIAKGINDSKKYAEKSAQEIGQAILDKAEKNLSNSNVYYETSLKKEMEYWDAVRKEIKKGTQARIDADAKYLQAKKSYKESLANENAQILSNAEKTLANQKIYRNVDLASEVEYWNAIRKQIKKGTQERIDADTKYKDSMKSYREAIKKTKDDAATLSKTFVEQFEEINNALSEKIIEVEKKYSDALEQRASGLTSSISLFEQFKKADLPKYTEIVGIDDEGNQITKDVTANANMLINNLQDQVYAIHEWNSVLGSLTNKLGSDNPLLKQFESMGVNSYDTLKLINDMTDEQLNTYVNLYNQYAAEAMNRARAENEDLKQQTKEETERLKADAAEKIQGLKDQYAKDLKALAKEAKKNGIDVGENIGKGVEKGIKDKKKDAIEAARLVAEKVSGAKSNGKTAGKTIGQYITDGMTQGIRQGKSSVVGAMVAVAKEAESRTRNALGIASPSKKFAWIGKMIDDGLAQGIDKNTSTVDSAMERLSNITDFQSAKSYKTNPATATAQAGNTTITMNIYGAQGQDVRALADEVERRLNSKVTRSGLIYA